MKFHEVQAIHFEGQDMILKVDGKKYRLDLQGVSPLLANASDSARNNYSVSASGYGIHWPAIDEDLSIRGLIASAQTQ